MSAREPRNPVPASPSTWRPLQAVRSTHNDSCDHTCGCWDGRIAATEWDRDHTDPREDWK